MCPTPSSCRGQRRGYTEAGTQDVLLLGKKACCWTEVWISNAKKNVRLSSVPLRILNEK